MFVVPAALIGLVGYVRDPPLSGRANGGAGLLCRANEQMFMYELCKRNYRSVIEEMHRSIDRGKG